MTICNNDYLFLSGDHPEYGPAESGVMEMIPAGHEAIMLSESRGRYEVRAIQLMDTRRAGKTPRMVMCYRFSSKSRARRLIRSYQSLGIPARLYRWRRS